jgi:hypothetical protein
VPDLQLLSPPETNELKQPENCKGGQKSYVVADSWLHGDL